jgi:hypothetical protein
MGTRGASLGGKHSAMTAASAATRRRAACVGSCWAAGLAARLPHRPRTCLVSGSTCRFQDRILPQDWSSEVTTSSGTLGAIFPTYTDVDLSTMLTTRGRRGIMRRSAGPAKRAGRGGPRRGQGCGSTRAVAALWAKAAYGAGGEGGQGRGAGVGWDAAGGSPLLVRPRSIGGSGRGRGTCIGMPGIGIMPGMPGGLGSMPG